MVEDLGVYDFLSPRESRGFKEGSRGYTTGAQGKQGLAAASREVMMDLPCPSRSHARRFPSLFTTLVKAKCG